MPEQLGQERELQRRQLQIAPVQGARPRREVHDDAATDEQRIRVRRRG
jgi:hypothetical protein